MRRVFVAPIVVVIVAQVGAACTPAFHVDLLTDPEDATNADDRSFDGDATVDRDVTGPDHVWRVFDWHNDQHLDFTTTTWAYRSITVNLFADVAVGTTPINANPAGDNVASVSFAEDDSATDFDPPRVWAATGGSVVIDDIEADRIAWHLKDIALEPDSDDARGHLVLEGSGVTLLDNH